MARLVTLAGAVMALLLGAGSALAGAAATFNDATGDANDAPDITSVTVSDAADGTISVRVAVRDLQTLPRDARFLLFFDLDNNPQTGAAGDEAVARYSSDGTLELFRWNGAELAPASAAAMTATFANGTLTFTAPRLQLSGNAPFGIVAVALRRQVLGGTAAVATDFAPVGTANVYSATGEKSFPDPEGDEDVAPDISAISVTDARNGTVSIQITTANYRTLPQDKLIGLAFDLLGRSNASDELFMTYQGGPGSIDIERETDGLVSQDTPPNRVTTSYVDGVLTLNVHRSELNDVVAFKFGVITADLTADGEGEGEDAVGEIEAIDIAPEGLETGTMFTYKLTNPPPVHLSLGTAVGAPKAPRSGGRFVVSAVVTRSDTGKVVRSGIVTCTALLGRASLPVAGRFVRGRATCTVVVPAGKQSLKLRVTMRVRAAGATVRAVTTYVVR